MQARMELAGDRGMGGDRRVGTGGARIRGQGGSKLSARRQQAQCWAASQELRDKFQGNLEQVAKHAMPHSEIRHLP